MSTRNTSNESSRRSGVLRAGVARSDITIDAAEAKTEIADRLYAKALALDDGTTKLVIVTMDVTAIGARKISDNMLPDVSEEFLPRLRQRVETELKIPGANVMVNASHTHPPGRMLCDDEEQIKRVFDAVRRASSDMVEARIGSGVGHESRITMNRTLRMKDGRHWTIRHANPSPPNEDVAGLGPLDPAIGIIRVDRASDGTPLAVVYNFAAHLLFADPRGKITANFTGIASELIEQTLGHGATAMFVQGAAGDVVDVTFKEFFRPRDMQYFGQTLALSTLRALREIPTSPGGKLRVVSETIQLPHRTDIPRRIEAWEAEQHELLESLRGNSLNFETFLPLYLKFLMSPDHPLDYSYRYLQMQAIDDDALQTTGDMVRGKVEQYVRNIRAMEKLGRIRENIDTLKKHEALIRASGSTSVPAELQVLRLSDDCVILAAPLEVLTEVSLNVKQASPIKHTFVAAFSNGYLHYGAPVHHYDKLGYEVNECLLAPQWQQIFESNVAELLRKV